MDQLHALMTEVPLPIDPAGKYVEVEVEALPRRNIREVADLRRY